MRSLALVSLVGLVACDGAGNRNGVRGTQGLYDGGLGAPDLTPADPNADYDHDGTSANQGDCNDFEPRIGPGSIEVVGNSVDDDCDGLIDEDVSNCASGLAAKSDAPSLTKSIGVCDDNFLVSTSFKGPSAPAARGVLKQFGIIKPKEGTNMVLLSTGNAADKMGNGSSMASYKAPQVGTDLGQSNEFTNPDPTIVAKMGCGEMQPATVNDYTEYVVKLKVPMNALSFSFQFQFFSAEYPEFVCTIFNDEFLVMMETESDPKPTNISFDEMKNPITVNNGFFTVCENGPKPQTMNCKKPVSEIAGTGYEDKEFGTEPTGGSTGWLTTTAPVNPGETITLRFIIFDEGDHIYDSAVLIDNFLWSTNAVDGPVTIQ